MRPRAPVQTCLEAYGVSSSASPTAHASIVLLVAHMPLSQSEALLQLVRRQARAGIELSEEAASLWFWRDRAATATERPRRRARDGEARARR
jgi:hypothetical protein